MIKEAKRRGWSVSYFGPEEYFYEISTPAGKHCIYRGSMPQGGSWFGNRVARHKLLTNEYLQDRGFKVAPFLAFSDEASAETFLQTHHPIVVKPENAAKSMGVTVGVETLEQLQKAVEQAKQYSEQVILQKQLTGKLYRILVIRGVFCAATHRRAAFVAGDGAQTIRQLITKKNADPLRTEDGNPLTKISIEAAGRYIGQERLDTVPAQGEEVVLSAIDSLSCGGEAADVTDTIHQDYVGFAEKIARELGLPACGLDVMMPDSSVPLEAHAIFPVLEVNSIPGFKMHYYPTAGGKPRDVAAALLDATLGKV
jgi:cyanophycin synthetase